jgi:hypothetical protein
MPTPARKRREPRDPISSYLFEMRRYAVYMTLRSEAEARTFQRTGEHQEIDELAFYRDDDRTTRLRLECYQQWLRAASLEGRYSGGTTLKRFLPDGSTEPWQPQEPVSDEPEFLVVEVTAPASAPEAESHPTPIPPLPARAGALGRLRASASRLIGRLVA